MLIIPSIDLLDGRCVRLLKGSYAESTVYSEDPAEVAATFEKAGARWIHVVDLDAARGGGRNNRRCIAEIRKAVSCSVEVGGGIREDRDVEELLEAGIDRLIVGTVLVRDPERVGCWIDEYGGVFVGAVDALDGMVRIAGWEGEGAVRDTELAESSKQLGIRGIIYTSIRRDGTMSGPDLNATNLVAAASGLPVILSGGIGGERDIERVDAGRGGGVVGAIVGRAYYEGRVSLPMLFERYRQADDRW